MRAHVCALALLLLAAGDPVAAQSTASDARLTLSPAQQEQIYKMLSVQRRDKLPIDPTKPSQRLVVGSEVPDTIPVHNMPEDAVAEIPMMQPYRFAVVENEVLIVEPRSRRIVEIIHR